MKHEVIIVRTPELHCFSGKLITTEALNLLFPEGFERDTLIIEDGIVLSSSDSDIRPGDDAQPVILKGLKARYGLNYEYKYEYPSPDEILVIDELGANPPELYTHEEFEKKMVSHLKRIDDEWGNWFLELLGGDNYGTKTIIR